MTAEAIEVQAVVPLTLLPGEAARLAHHVRRILAAANGILGGGHQLNAEQVKTIRNATTQAMMITWEADVGPRDNVIDLDRERYRRRGGAR